MSKKDSYGGGDKGKKVEKHFFLLMGDQTD